MTELIIDPVFNLILEHKNISDEIICGKNLKFTFINGEKINKLIALEFNDNLSYLNILKYNFDNIIQQLIKYFPDIKINKFINSPSLTECKIKHINSTYKYDIYLVLMKDDKIYEYGFDFVFKLDSLPDNKYLDSKVLLDHYEYFVDEDVQTDVDIKYYLSNTLFKLLTAICTLNNDEYKLSEILFVKSNQENKTNKQILKELSYFLKIINWKKSNLIDLEDLFDNLLLVNNKTEKQVDIKEFMKIINDICLKKNIAFSIKQNTINYNIFELLLMNIDTNYSSNEIYQYKDAYLKAISILIESLKIIIEMVKEINMKKTFTTDYINNLIEFHLDEYINYKTINPFYKKMDEKKILFDEIIGDIDEVFDDDVVDQNKLIKIKNDFNSLFADLFN